MELVEQVALGLLAELDLLLVGLLVVLDLLLVGLLALGSHRAARVEQPYRRGSLHD